MAYNPTTTHDNFDRDKHYVRAYVQDADNSFFTGQDANEMASIHLDQITDLGAAVLSDGKVISGCAIAVDAETGDTSVAAGKVFAFGLVRKPAAASLTVPVVGDLFVGLWIRTAILDEDDDPDLIFNPAGASFDASGEPMSPRQQQLPAWGLSTDVHADTADVTWRFCPVYRIKDGVVIADLPTADAWDADLALYDREAHGNYSVDGMMVSALGLSAGAQIFVISAGTANAYGEKIKRSSDARWSEAESPPLRSITAEHHTYVDAAGSCVITLNHGPISSVTRVEILAQRTVTLTKGLANATDNLPDTSVDSIVSVVQGGTTYTATTDYVKSGDAVSWAPGGSEPSPGSSYQVTYKYFKVVSPTATGTDTVTVSGAVNGSSVAIDYSYKVPRVDILAIDAGAGLHYIYGPVNYLKPQPPAVPGAYLPLAEIANDWRGTPAVTQIAPVAVPFADLAAMKAAIDDLRSTVSRLSLQVAISIDQPSSRDRQFVDPMDDDSGRDLGLTQTAAIAGGVLRLPVTVSYQNLGNAAEIGPTPSYTRIRTKETAVGSISVQNASKYATMEILASADPRFVIDGIIASDTTLLARDIPWFETRKPAPGVGDRAKSYELKGQTLSVTVRGLTSGATLSSVLFDGVAATPTGGTANGSGVSTFTIPVPANLPAGVKTVEATYSDGSTAKATWDGAYGSHGKNTRPQLRNCPVRLALPPLKDQAGKVQVQLHAVSGNAPIYWEAYTGLSPDSVSSAPRAEACGLIDMAGKSAGDWVEITLPLGLGYRNMLAGSNDVSVVLGFSSSGAHALKTAAADDTRLGVNGGNLDPTKTLCHRIDAARFTGGNTDVTIGTFAVTGITDVAVLADGYGEPITDSGRIGEPTYVLSIGSETYEVVSGQVVPLESAYTGNITVKARVFGSGYQFSKVFMGGQLLLGANGTSGVYTSTSIAEATSDTVAVFFTALKVGSATIAVDVSDDSNVWHALTLASNTQLGNGVADFRYQLASFSAVAPKIRITLGGSVSSPVYLDDYRAVIY